MTWPFFKVFWSGESDKTWKVMAFFSLFFLSHIKKRRRRSFGRKEEDDEEGGANFWWRIVKCGRNLFVSPSERRFYPSGKRSRISFCRRRETRAYWISFSGVFQAKCEHKRPWCWLRLGSGTVIFSGGASYRLEFHKKQKKVFRFFFPFQVLWVSNCEKGNKFFALFLSKQ